MTNILDSPAELRCGIGTRREHPAGVGAMRFKIDENPPVDLVSWPPLDWWKELIDMPLTISDEFLKEMGLTEHEARVEVACRLFENGRIALWPAARMAGLDRVEFEEALLRRSIPLYRSTVADLGAELKRLRQMGV